MGPTWGPPGADRTKVGPMLAPWPLLSGTWWRHEMETFSALLAICVGNSPVPVNSPHKPVTRSFDVFFDLRLNKRLNKQSWGWWFETLSRSLWRHCNGWYSTCSVTSHYLKFWANAGLLLITEHFSEIQIKIHQFLYKIIDLKCRLQNHVHFVWTSVW